MAVPGIYLVPRPSADGLFAINLLYSFHGHKLQYLTGDKINKKFFKTADSKGKKIDRDKVNKIISDSAPYAAIIKDRITQIVFEAQRIVNSAISNKIPLSKEYVCSELDLIFKPKYIKPEKTVSYNFITYFEKVIEDSKSGIRLQIKGKNVGKPFSSNTIKNYGSTLSAIQRFMKKSKIRRLEFDEINKEFYNEFRTFIYDIEEKEVSTFGGFIKDIKTMMDEAFEAGLQSQNGHNSSYFLIPPYEADTKALTIEELDLIHNHDFSHNKPLDHIRDLFLVGAYSALRFGNFSKLKIESIENGFLRVRQIKTGNIVVIPVMKGLKRILDKYNGSFPPAACNQYFNRMIKEVIKAVGLTYMVDVISHPGNIRTVTQHPIYALISSHTARRTFATIMFKLGIPILLIMSATGHKTEARFLIYIKATNEDKSKLFAQALQDLNLLATG